MASIYRSGLSARPSGSTTQTVSSSSSGRIVPAVVLIYSFLLPQELTIELFNIELAPYRIMLVLMLPLAIYHAGRHRMTISFIDMFILFAMAWMLVAFTITEGFATGFVAALSDAMNMGLAYFIGRASIRTSADLRSISIAVIPALLFCSLIVAIEALSHQAFYRPFFLSLTGYVPPNELGDGYQNEVRMGMMRAEGPFGHPILAGVFLSSFTAFIWYLVQKPGLRLLGIIGISGFFFSLSSTGYLVFIVITGLMIVNYIHHKSGLPVFPAFIAGTLFVLLFIEVFSGNGALKFIIRNLTLTPQTGYFRLLIWEYGGADLNRNPLFGIGVRPYVRPGWMHTASVDAQWLVFGLRYGYPTMLAIAAAVLAAAATALRGAWSPYPLDQRAAYALCYTLIALAIGGLAVHLYEAISIWQAMLIGVGVTFGQIMAEATRLGKTQSGVRPRLRLKT